MIRLEDMSPVRRAFVEAEAEHAMFHGLIRRWQKEGLDQYITEAGDAAIQERLNALALKWRQAEVALLDAIQSGQEPSCCGCQREGT